jgi:hypothetical protein
VSSAPEAAPSTRNWTPLTPTSSLAVAFSVTAPETVVPAGGSVSVTVGAWSASEVALASAEEALRLVAASAAFTR